MGLYVHCLARAVGPTNECGGHETAMGSRGHLPALTPESSWQEAS